MERYKEISVAELFEHILKDDYTDIYYQDKHSKSLSKASTESWTFNEFKKYKWFKREVLD